MKMLLAAVACFACFSVSAQDADFSKEVAVENTANDVGTQEVTTNDDSNNSNDSSESAE